MKLIKLPHYTVFLGSVVPALTQFLQQQQYSKLAIICDENTEKYCLPMIADAIEDFGLIRTSSGEENKSLASCSEIWHRMLELNLDRKSMIINLGGGVIGDMGGFCAGTFMRGISFVQVPTTLLSQVDASVGGKLGIDFNRVKNCVGLFGDPKAIFVDPFFLNTLPERQILSGMTEMLKHGLIGDKQLFESMISADQYQDFINNEMIHRAILVKKEVVEKDPFEQGWRKVLNLGHSLGHALESHYLESDQSLLHGEAIAFGLVGELYLSKTKLGLTDELLNRVIHYVKKWFPTVDFSDLEIQNMISLLGHDKKNEHGDLIFSLLNDIEDPEINVKVMKREAEKALVFSRNKLSENQVANP